MVGTHGWRNSNPPCTTLKSATAWVDVLVASAVAIVAVDAAVLPADIEVVEETAEKAPVDDANPRWLRGASRCGNELRDQEGLAVGSTVALVRMPVTATRNTRALAIGADRLVGSM